MNIEKKNECVEKSLTPIIERAKLELKVIYNHGYIEGRHDYRDKLKKFLIINPELKESLEKAKEDPCKDCPNALTMLKVECLNSAKCELKQNQFIALDILKHFK